MQPYDNVSKPLANNAYPLPTNGGAGYAPPQVSPAPSNYGSPCSLAREDLDQYLSLSGYGSNLPMFNCYFTRDGPNTPPLCIACRRHIGDHRNGAMQSSSPHLAVPVPVTGQCYNPLPMAMVMPAAAPPVSFTVPMYMSISDAQDTLLVPSNQNIRVVICVLGVLAVVQAIAFVASGMMSRSPVVLIGPLFLIGIICFLLYYHKAIQLTFHKGQGPRSRVDVVERLLLGCSSMRTMTVADLGAIVCRETNARINGQLIFEVVASGPCGTATPLFRGYHYECAPQFLAWQQYLAQYGIAPTGGMPPPAAIDYSTNDD